MAPKHAVMQRIATGTASSQQTLRVPCYINLRTRPARRGRPRTRAAAAYGTRPGCPQQRPSPSKPFQIPFEPKIHTAASTAGSDENARGSRPWQAPRPPSSAHRPSKPFKYPAIPDSAPRQARRDQTRMRAAGDRGRRPGRPAARRRARRRAARCGRRPCARRPAGARPGCARPGSARPPPASPTAASCPATPVNIYTSIFMLRLE